jgi:hypothetical protein
MVRSRQPTGGQPRWFSCSAAAGRGGGGSKAKNLKVAHEHTEHREHDEFILVRASEE